MARGLTEIEKPYVLVVEHENDWHFFDQFLKQLDIQEYQVFHGEGKDSLSKVIDVLSAQPGFRNLKAFGLIRDADNLPDAAFQSLRDAFKSVSLPEPRSSGEIAGTIIKSGIFILPGSGQEGCLQDLIIRSIKDQPAFECVDSFLECLERKNCAPQAISKAKVQAYLAGFDEPDARLKIALLRRILPFEHSAFDELKNFFNSLFGA
jgi:hypothetical protein